MRGYEVVRSQYFSTTQNPAMTIADGKLSFNTACLKKFENVEYVELLLNSVNRCIAVRPCDGNNPNAIHWGKLREGRWCALSKSCRGLAKTLFDIMDWDQDLKYRFRGDFIENDDQKVMLFQLDEPEMVKTENIVLPPKEAETDDRAEIAGRTVKQIIYILLRNGRTHLEDRLPASERLIYWSRGTMRLIGMFCGRQRNWPNTVH